MAEVKKPSKPRGRSKPPKLRTAGAADLADIKPLAKKALEEIGDGNKLAADVATKINEILRKRGEKLFELKSLTAFLQPSKYGKALGVGARKDTYEYAGLSNPQLLSASADCIAFVVDRDAKGVPIMYRDVAAGYLILEEAGGRVTDFVGGPPDRSGREVASSNGALHAALLERIVRTP